MKKKLSFFFLALVFAILSFSTSSLAIESDNSFENGQIISESIVQDYFPYVIALEDGKYMEFTNHWTKRINHLPANKCNLCIEPNGHAYF